MTKSRYLINKYCPSLYTLLERRKYKKWNDLDNLIEKQLNSQKSIKTNLVRLLLEIESSSNPFLIAFSKHIDQIILELIEMFPEKEKKIWNSINGKIDNLEDWNYLNPIGEFSVLLKLQKSGLFELKEIETQFPNGRTKDFLFQQKSSNQPYLVEVLNIHLPLDCCNFDDQKEILLSKTKKKIDREVENVFDKSILKHLFIFPVVWYLKINDIRENYDFFSEFSKSLGKSFGMSHQIIGFCTYVKTPDNKFIFGEASTIVEQYLNKNKMEEEVEFVGEEYVWKSTESKPFAFGGNSEVYLVTSSTMQGNYALKIITNDKNLSQRRDRFLEEIRVVKEIASIPGCVRIIDHGFEDDRPFYVMPYYENGTMAKKYLNQENKDIKSILNDFKKIILTVKRIHSFRLAIRDIKPQNILIDSEGLPVISDFGLSLSVDTPHDVRLTVTGELVGSQGYMPPEWGGKNPDPNHLSGDIWSLGRVLWAFCSSKQPPNNFETLGGGDTHLNKYLDRQIANLIQGVITTCTSQLPESRPNIDELISLTDELINNIEVEQNQDQKRLEKLESFLKRSAQQIQNSKTVIDSRRADSELNIKISELKEATDLIAVELQKYIPSLNSHHSDIGSFRILKRYKDWTNRLKSLTPHQNSHLGSSVTLRFDPNDKVVEFGNMSYVMTKFQLGITEKKRFYWSIYSRDQGNGKEFFTEEIETKSILLLVQNKLNKLEDFVKEPFLELLLINFK